MQRFTVNVTRTDHLTFVVEADDTQDAEDRYLTDGEEVGRDDPEMTVDSITQTNDKEPPDMHPHQPLALRRSAASGRWTHMEVTP